MYIQRCRGCIPSTWQFVCFNWRTNESKQKTTFEIESFKFFFEKVLAGVRNGYMTPLQAGRARCHYDLKWSALWLRVCIHSNMSIKI